MKTTDLIARTVRDLGASHYFGIPGSGALLDLMESGRRAGLDLVTTANESSAAIAAAYYGHLAGGGGMAVAIKGPGAGNLASGALNASFERKPVVCLCERASADPGVSVAQRSDHRALFAAAVKGSFDLSREDGAQDLAEAFALAAAGRPGPVLVELPSNLDEVLDRRDLVDVSAPPVPGPASDRDHLARAAAFISELSRPVIIAGSDIVRGGAVSAFRSFAEAMGAAVLVATDARGVYPESSARFAGVFPNLGPERVIGNRILREADGALLIGCDPLAFETPWTRALPVCEIRAASTLEAAAPRAAIRIDGPLGGTLGSLSGARPSGAYPVELIRTLRAETDADFRRPGNARFTAQDVIEVTRSVLPSNGILFSETGVFVLMLEHLWRVESPDTFFGTAGGRTMGLAIPALIGGRLARPDTPMLAIGADGSALMRLGELETLARTRGAAPVVIVNDQALGTIKSRQKARGLPAYGLRLSHVDFAGVARSVGIRGATVHTPEGFERELRAAFEEDVATVIDARVDPEAYRDGFGPTTGN